MSSKTRIQTSLKRKLKRIENDIYGNYISLFASYDKIPLIKIKDVFRDGLFLEPGFFLELLSLNENAVKDADLLSERKFRIFSSTINCRNQDNIWHKDFFSDYVYPVVPFTRIKLETDRGHDPIVPWEFSRMQFIPTLIQAHHTSGNEKYLSFFQEITFNWIKKNPYLKGINWKCAMDVGIRGVNLSLGFLYFYNHFGDNEKNLYQKVLWAHLLYLLNHESYKNYRSERKHNHFLVSTICLMILGSMFSEKQADECFRLSSVTLKEEILRQFEKDGVNFETSNHYHQFAVEAVLYAKLFLKIYEQIEGSVPNIFNDPEVNQRIDKAINFTADYQSAFKMSPQIGDSSDGRFIIHKDYFTYDALDHSYLKEIYEITSPSGYDFKAENIYSLYKNSGNGFFANGKYGVCVTCSDTYYEYTGHSHPDKASFLLRVKDWPVFVDSGTYCYTSNIRMREEHRNTRAHNVFMLDGKEQTDYKKGEAFSYLNNLQCNLNSSKQGEIIKFRMTHTGFQRLHNVQNYSREIKCYPDKIEITDKISGSGNRLVEIIFNLHPLISYKIDRHSIIFYLKKKEICALDMDEKMNCSAEKSFYSPFYMKRLDSTRIVLFSRIDLPAYITNSIIT